MPTTSYAELYFITGAFVLIMIICTASVFFFVRQLRREKGAHSDPRSVPVEPAESPGNQVTSTEPPAALTDEGESSDAPVEPEEES